MSNGIPLHHNYQNQLKPEGLIEIMIEISSTEYLFDSNYRLQMGRHARQIRLKIYCTSQISGATAKRNLEKDPI